MTSTPDMTSPAATLTTSGAKHWPPSTSISPGGFITVAALLTFVWLVGTLFNGLSLSVFVLNKGLRSPTNMFIIALNVCDLSMCFVGTFMAMTSAWKRDWLYGNQGCIFEGFMVYFLGLTSLYLLCAVSLDRYIIIAKPLLSHRITHKVAGGTIAACWLGGFLWAAFPLMGWNEYVLEGAGVSCSVVWESSNPNYTSYIFTIFVFCFLLPLALMVFSYYHVYMTIRHMSRSTTWSQQSRVAKRNLKVEKKMAKTVAVLFVVFLCCWMPYSIFSFTVVFQGSEAVSAELATYPAVLAKSQGLFNPLIYVVTNKQFRMAFYNIVPCSRFRRILQDREEQHTGVDQDSTHLAVEDVSASQATTYRAGDAKSRGPNSFLLEEPKALSTTSSSRKSMGQSILPVKNAVQPIQEDRETRKDSVFTISEQLDSPTVRNGRASRVKTDVAKEELEVIELTESVGVTLEPSV